MTPTPPRAQVLSGKAYDVAVDVYACGIVMYALLAGRLPFDAGETDLERARTARIFSNLMQIKMLKNLVVPGARARFPRATSHARS